MGGSACLVVAAFERSDPASVLGQSTRLQLHFTAMSIADKLRAEQAERLKQLDVTARVELAFALGSRDIALYAAAHAVSTDEARLRLRNQRKTGRVPSRSAGE